MDSFLKQYCSKEWQEFVDFHKKTYSVKAKEHIFNEGEATKGLYIVNAGKVKVVTKGEERDTLIRLAADGDILGHRGFGGDWAYPISAIALEDTTVSFIPLAIFNQIVKANTEFSYQLMMFFAEELRRSEEKIALIPVKNRVAKSIYYTYQAFGYKDDDPGMLSFTLTRKEMASKAGTTYETVIRMLAELNKSEIIRLENKEIRILDMDQLSQLARPFAMMKSEAIPASAS
ncbi:MAG: transcriptional regulator [Crocinitomicaceae bacterium]|nr:transcriptional regulator [Crocinitomicaceae bacterium]|tara:strand:+ start:4162 stop:4854 length:693 start_codon:yes stop_codon:yes gene_type:complete